MWICIPRDGPFHRVKEINSVLNHRPVPPVLSFRLVRNTDLLSAFHWHLPDARRFKLGIVKKPPIGRFCGKDAAVFGYLDWWLSVEVDLPYLKRPADQGYPDAEADLGYAYETGKAVSLDYIAAFAGTPAPAPTVTAARLNAANLFLVL